MKVQRIWEIETLLEPFTFRLHCTERTIDVRFVRQARIYPQFIAYEIDVKVIGGRWTEQLAQVCGLTEYKEYRELTLHDRLQQILYAHKKDVLPTWEQMSPCTIFHDNNLLSRNEFYFYYHNFVFVVSIARNGTNRVSVVEGDSEKPMHENWSDHFGSLLYLKTLVEENYPLKGSIDNRVAMLQGIVRGETEWLEQYQHVVDMDISYLDFKLQRNMPIEIELSL